MRRSTKERAKKLLEEMKPLVWTGTFKELCHRLPELEYQRSSDFAFDVLMGTDAPKYLMHVCDRCGDYSYLSGETPCDQDGYTGTMHRATPEQECDGCANPHRDDIGHTCNLNTYDPLAAYGSGGAIAATYGGVERLAPTGSQCMYCGGLNGVHQKGCKR